MRKIPHISEIPMGVSVGSERDLREACIDFGSPRLLPAQALTSLPLSICYLDETQCSD